MNAAAALFLVAQAAAEPRSMGIGIQAGAPTGITAKSFVTPWFAFDLGAGVGGMYHRAGWDRNNYTLHFDFLWQSPITPATSWHVGAGARLVTWIAPDFHDGTGRDNHGYLRAPFGVDVALGRFELFVEAAPNVLVVPLDLGIDAVIGVRFYPEISP